MKFDKRTDIVLNIIQPLLLGLLIYGSIKLIAVPPAIRNYLPDGFWAYAFMSCILIIWERKINIIWIILVFLFSICFELLQYYQIIPGTGDIGDVLTYFLFFVIALTLNSFFKNLISTPN